MTWNDEALMAFVDNELDDRERARLKLALSADVSLRRRLAALKQLRRRVEAAFAPVLEEPVPDRLKAALRAPARATAPAVPPAKASFVATPPAVDLDEVRAARSPLPRMGLSGGLSPWWQWGGMAAALALGVLLGTQLDRVVKPGGASTAGLQQAQDGRLLAHGVVDQALSTQLASEPVNGAPVAVQLSFVDKAGSYCRTFSTAALAGLACRQNERWAVQTLAAVETGADSSKGNVRQAATILPPAVLEAVDTRIRGNALDAARERQARDQGWGK
jgi:anti-sigma factor RsiW